MSKDSPPAFPGASVLQRGMTLHEYYVGQAIAGLAATHSSNPQWIVARARDIADAAMEARS